MFLEPNRTQYDLNFSILGIPVRVHPLFWLVSLVLGFRAGEPAAIAIWVGVVFVSILVHELGHAIMMRYYGFQPSIVLYGGGGLAMYHGGGSPWSSYGSYGKQRDDPITQIIISFAGPAAGFILAGIVIAYLFVTQTQFKLLGLLPIGVGSEISNPILYYLVGDLLFVNIFWGLVNLLPIYPLDGGKISREIFSMLMPYDAVRQSLWLSLITAGIVAVVGFWRLGPFMGIMFAMFAVMNWQMLQGFGGGGYGGGGRPW